MAALAGIPPTFEDILNIQLGGFGAFQVLILVLILVMEIPSTFVAFIPVFHGSGPKTWTCGNETMSKIDVCSCPGTFTPNSDAENSIVAEWNLICDKVWLSDFFTSLQMFGGLIGTFLGGTLADWYGRKFSLMLTLGLEFVGQALSALAPNPFVYAFARFIAGAGMAGFITVSAIYAMEFLTPKWRPLCGSVGPWGEGIMMLAFIGYLIRPWRYLTWVLTTPYLLLLPIYLLLPESPRWLLGRKRIAESYKVLQYMAKVNRKDEISLETLNQIAEMENMTSDDSRKKHSYLDFFREKSLRRPTLCFMSLWVSWALTYFGISYNIKNMTGDLYMNVFYSGLSDATGYLAPLLTVNRFGRRKSLAIFLFLTATFLVTLAIFDIISGMAAYPTVTLVLLFLGKFAIGGVRSGIRCLLGETYPTSIRGMGSALGGLAVGVGAVLAPQLAFAGTYFPSIPYLTFAGTSLISVGISFMLQETKDKPLPEGINIRKESVVKKIIRRASRSSQQSRTQSIESRC